MRQVTRHSVARSTVRRATLASAAAVIALTGVAGCANQQRARPLTPVAQEVQQAPEAQPAQEAQPAPEAPEAPAQTPPTAGPPPAAPAPPPQAAPVGLPVIGYSAAPAGFPPDPEPLSTVPLTEAAQPIEKIVAYDAPGGKPRAYLAPTISGVPLIMPIVARQAGWVAVLLPSANRAIAWITTQGWATVALRDQLVVRRGTHQLVWYRDGAPYQTWTVALGSRRTPTPLGRTFVLGRSRAAGEGYAGVDVLALGNLPDDPSKVATGLKGAHIGIHAWYRSDVFGKSISNGCIRLPKAAQEMLLSQIGAGSEVVVTD